MNTEEKNTVSRRSALVASLRWGVGGLMALTTGLFVSRKQVNRENACIDPKGRLGCRNCSLLQGCGLPRGLSVKQYLNRNNGKRNS
ncbi:MAG: hypothetical protein ACYSOL_04800 [Planctomycetota bacterium]|jgi:hypothetical protein